MFINDLFCMTIFCILTIRAFRKHFCQQKHSGPKHIKCMDAPHSRNQNIQNSNTHGSIIFLFIEGKQEECLSVSAGVSYVSIADEDNNSHDPTLLHYVIKLRGLFSLF